MLLVQQIILKHIFLRKVIHFSNDIIKEFTIIINTLFLPLAEDCDWFCAVKLFINVFGVDAAGEIFEHNTVMFSIYSLRYKTILIISTELSSRYLFISLSYSFLTAKTILELSFEKKHTDSLNVLTKATLSQASLINLVIRFHCILFILSFCESAGTSPDSSYAHPKYLE